MAKKTKIIDIVIIPYVFFTLLFLYQGCCCNLSNKVIIDKQFLYDIEQAYREEINSGRQMHMIYNTLWEDNYYELIYLVEKGDHKAIDISIMMIGQREDPACLVEDIELLVKPTYESDTNYFWLSLRKRNYDTQVKVLNVFEHFNPLDWNMQWYLGKYPKIKELYESKYGKIGIGNY